MHNMIKPIYNIGQQVYHATPESEVGIVTDCKYSLYYRTWYYEVAFGAAQSSYLYTDVELSDTKIFK